MTLPSLPDDEDAAAVNTEDIPSELEQFRRTNVLGVQYVHVELPDGDDLYITEYGIPFCSYLLPANYWTDQNWFKRNSQRLRGTSSLYKIRTKEIHGESKDIVLKWNRMGQDIPGQTATSDLAGAQFNSPFEEFSLVIELRNARYESPGQVYTHKPLAIYVPRAHVELERLGRKRYRLEAKQKKHTEVKLEMFRNYAVIYEWVKGIDAAQACDEGVVDKRTLEGLTLRVGQEMKRKGFVVRDNKAHHLIVRPADGRLLADRHGRIIYAYVDFELLQRTPQREREIRASKRKTYLTKQAHRFEAHERFPPNLTPVTIFGVDYVYGRTESTQGALWVVGKDPVLFEYFLPEKWRKTRRRRLSAASQVYDTITKDNIHLVWRVSRVGQRPTVDLPGKDQQSALSHGYNSPFEEVALSMELNGQGIDTIYPRAIYMTGPKPDVSSDVPDAGRYRTHEKLRTSDGHPVLSRHHDYMIIWGYWNGPDEMLAAKDEDYYKGIDALQAYKQGLLSEEMYLRLMRITRERLTAAGIEDLNLRGSHLLLSLDKADRLVMDGRGVPTVRICNFELLRCAES